MLSIRAASRKGGFCTEEPTTDAQGLVPFGFFHDANYSFRLMNNRTEVTMFVHCGQSCERRHAIAYLEDEPHITRGQRAQTLPPFPLTVLFRWIVRNLATRPLCQLAVSLVVVQAACSSIGREQKKS